jgi:antitoxin component YwqK of YwqJK toxin-antitoxin module
MCIDEINTSQYNGNLTQKELENQIAVLGFRYIENGQNKYHQDLIVYDCNTGDVKFTAVFDENKLVKDFLLYESKDVPSKKIKFLKNNESPYVDLNFKFKGQEIPAYPNGQAKIYTSGQLIQTIQFNQDGRLPVVTNYNRNKKKVSEGTATLSGEVQKDWEISKIGEWKYFENGQLSSISVFDNKGIKSSEKLYSNGNLTEENKFLANGTVETTIFYNNGNVKEKRLQKGNIKFGTWSYFTSEGKHIAKIEFQNGRETLKRLYDDQGKITKQIELINEKSELPESFQQLDEVFAITSFYPNSTIKSMGFESAGKKIGVFESYNKNGELSEITEFDLGGNEINSLDADTYISMKKKESVTYKELLIAKTTLPLNHNLEKRIKSLADSLTLDFDSLLANDKNSEYYNEQFSKLEEQTSYFGNLSNTLVWYDSLLTTTQDFTNELWSYSNELYDAELKLQKYLAVLKAQENLAWLKKNYTSTKKTLFGKKTIVVNEQKEVYEAIINEFYPTIKSEIVKSNNKYQTVEKTDEFTYLVKKAAAIIDQPDNEFKETLKNLETIEEKKQLFLSLK